MKFEEASECEVLEDRDTPKRVLEEFLSTGVKAVRLDLRKVNYSSVTNFVNSMRVYIGYHNVPVVMKRRRNWLYLKRK